MEMIQAVLQQLSEATGASYREAGAGEWVGPCPVCQPAGRGRHLSVTSGLRRPVVLHCHRGCDFRAILQAGGLADLGLRPPSTDGSRMPEAAEITYDYTNRDGALLVQVVRRGSGRGKKIYQRRPDGAGGWEYRLDGVVPPLYRLPALLLARPGATVALTEGEADADRLAGLGIVATTTIRGTSGWEARYAADLAGFRVAILPDMDQPGITLARQRQADLRAAGGEAVIAWLPLPITPTHGRDVSDWIAEGHTAADVQALIVAAFAGELHDPARPPPRYVFLSERQLLELPPPTWQVEDLCETRELTVCHGLSGAGKTFFVTDLALSITQGRDWCGRRVTAGRVLYVNADGGRGFAKRVRAWRTAHGAEGEARFTICEQPVCLLDPGAVSDFVAQAGQAYDLVVIDTLSQCMPGADEISTRDMSLVTDSLRRIRTDCEASVLAQHHSTKDGTAWRGVLTLVNAAATAIHVAQAEGGAITARCEKQRNWARFEPLEFTLKAMADSCILVRGGTPSRSVLKELNKEDLMWLIRSEPGISAADLIQRSRIPQSTLYRMVTELVTAGRVAVREMPDRPGRGAFPLGDA